ncbi:hypothetical protein AGMMS50229_06460 [Campylobacterota bacterium]|nr:hypothetical protein AGMMS50229_06460 [Campylobacterota bacterium]
MNEVEVARLINMAIIGGGTFLMLPGFIVFDRILTKRKQKRKDTPAAV